MKFNAPPQVIRRSDGTFAVLNVDIDPLSLTQRVALATLVWDQVRELLEVAGEYKERDFSKLGSVGIGKARDIDHAIAPAVGVKPSSLYTTRPRLQKRPDVLERALAGEFQFSHDMQRAMGKRLRTKISEGAQSNVKPGSKMFGRGDRFEDSIAPLDRYLQSWKKKDFLFTHVNPKEAQRRVKLMDEVLDNLNKAREDLVMRSHAATLSSPPERKRRENS